MVSASHAYLFVIAMARATLEAAASVPSSLVPVPATKPNTSVFAEAWSEASLFADWRSDRNDFREVISSVESAFGSNVLSDIGKRVAQISEIMLSVFASSPKNVHGRLNSDSARYVLSRVLMERHGWDLPSRSEVRQDQAAPLVAFLGFGGSLPSLVRAALEKSIANQGAGILELSVFIAVIEQIVFDKIPRQLKIVYRALNIPFDTVVSKMKAEAVIDLYMGSYLLSEDLSRLSASEVLSFQKDIPSRYINWAGAKRYFSEIQKSVVPNLQRFTFSNMTYVLSSIEKQFVHFLHGQCSGVKAKLLELEADASGRVRLLDFYNSSFVKGYEEFRETMPYLEDLGVIDESDSLDPRVVISNYLDGPSNCFASSSLYSVCCVDECGGLYGHIEKAVNQPEAPPEQIIEIVKRLASPSMQHGRLSNAIVSRIHDIAKEHDGMVPLHGSRFAEWMHFAYPRECTHPKMFGPAHEKTISEWEKETHSAVEATEEQLRSYVEQLKIMDERKSEREKTIAMDEANIESSCWAWNTAPKNFTLEKEDDNDGFLGVDHEEDSSFQTRRATILRYISLLLVIIGLLSTSLHHLHASHSRSLKRRAAEVECGAGELLCLPV